MGLYKDSMNGQSPDLENDPSKREEDYEKLYMKIARDFVHKDDLAEMLNELIDHFKASNAFFAASTENINLPVRRASAALQKAQLYKFAMDNGLDLVATFAKQDLINLDEEE